MTRRGRVKGAGAPPPPAPGPVAAESAPPLEAAPPSTFEASRPCGLPEALASEMNGQLVTADLIAMLATRPGVTSDMLLGVGRAHGVAPAAIDAALAAMGEHMAASWRHVRTVGRAQILAGLWAAYTMATKTMRAADMVKAITAIANVLGVNEPIQVAFVSSDEVRPERIREQATRVLDLLPTVVAVLGRAAVLAAIGLREIDVEDA